MSEKVYVTATWDSGPYGIYYESATPQAVPRNGYGELTAPVPREIWEGYNRAESEFRAAEKALGDALSETQG